MRFFTPPSSSSFPEAEAYKQSIILKLAIKKGKAKQAYGASRQASSASSTLLLIFFSETKEGERRKFSWHNYISFLTHHDMSLLSYFTYHTHLKGRKKPSLRRVWYRDGQYVPRILTGMTG